MTIAFGLFSWGPALIWAGLIFFLSSIPSLTSGLVLWDFTLRKIAHVVEFAVLTALLIRAFRRTWPHFEGRKIISWCFVLAVLYAVSDEFHQGFVPGRGPAVLDVLIDTLGIFLICTAPTRLKKKWRFY